MIMQNFFTDYPVFVPIIAIVVAEILKLITTYCREKKINWRDFFRTGGMPSGHATIVSSISTTVFVLLGWRSVEFAISAVFSVIVLYDAIKLRWEAGKHAKVLNYLLGKKKLEERLGHTPIELLTGIFLGVGIAFLLLSL